MCLERLELGKVVTRYKPTMALTIPILSWVRLSCIMHCLKTNIKFN